ncbi:hypothetical protein BDU57DRAFT_513394 [Ampelomyces quisqualis]|uniref:Uncharacterized protein n=1 Tax=Ampelomyces quisqualis TaxID=50730 RepID=A0A6A5QNA1_AMPQU|nr:hypothetical protein BDU57DRAFT_513394 [Ampelomyces quisqualis]
MRTPHPSLLPPASALIAAPLAPTPSLRTTRPIFSRLLPSMESTPCLSVSSWCRGFGGGAGSFRTGKLTRKRVK